MESGFFDRFFDSLAHLERALGSTRNVLEQKGALSNSVEARFESYNSILEKQKNLAAELHEYVSIGDWDEIVRRVNLINSLSRMMLEDAQSLKAAFSGDISAIDQDIPHC